MLTHPFKPLITTKTKKLLVGTLPPENVIFYFSNSSNTRLWDILKAINDNVSIVGKGGNELSPIEKKQIINNLGIGIADIIYQYEREVFDSTKDKHIAPKKYNDLRELVYAKKIDELIFVYKNALKWFLHSLESKEPVKVQKLRNRYALSEQFNIYYKNRIIKCTLLPSPLNRGERGQTLQYKLQAYRKCILSKEINIYG